MQKKLMKGNEAIAEAAVQAGCRQFFGYPITPQNEIPEYMSWRMPELGGSFVQAESEVSAINMVYGTAGAGGVVMTSSSGPGMSLKMEGISYIAGAELPCVLVSIMRAGPGLGGILPSQADYLQMVKGGGHGDYSIPVYAPSNVQEAVDFTQKAFKIAHKYRTPVAILADAIIGQMMEPVEIPTITDNDFDKSWATTGWDGHSRERNVVNSLHLEMESLEAHNFKLQDKYKLIQENEVMYKEFDTEDCDILVIAYGTVARIASTSIAEARKKGIKAGLLCPLTLFPFPEKRINELSKGKKAVLVVEMSSGQMLQDVKLSVLGQAPIEFYGRMGGAVPNAVEILEQIEKIG